MLNDGEDIVVIDVREQHEYDAGCFKGALHLSKGVIERDIEKHPISEDARIVLYCGGWFPLRHCSRILDSNGLQQTSTRSGVVGEALLLQVLHLKSIDYDGTYIFDKKNRYPSGQSPFMDPITTLGLNDTHTHDRLVSIRLTFSSGCLRILQVI